MKKYRGYTLIEMILVMIILVIIMGVIGLTLRAGTNSYSTSQPLVEMSSEAVFAVENVTRELQSALSLITIGANNITFINYLGQTVVVNLSSGNVNRSNDGGSTSYLLAANVSALNFVYYDGTLAVTATPANVRYVTMQITIQTVNGPQILSYTLLTGVVLRKII